MKKNVVWGLITALLALTVTACNPQSETTEPAATTAPTTEETARFTGDYIVDAAYVKEHLQDDNVVLVDARGEEAARKETIEGAVTTTWQNLSNVEEVKKGDYEWGKILEPAALSKKLSELGWAKDKEYIFFAEGPKGWGEDGRLLWTLRAAGYSNLKMVDGGLAALKESGLPTSQDVKTLEPVEVTVNQLDYNHVINTKEIETDYDNYVMLDVREDKEFQGEVLYGEAKGGRLPGAVQVRFTDLFDENGYLKSNEEIQSMFEAANIKKTDQIIAYCTSGIRSAYTQLVLEMLDYEVTKNYEGSYNTWCVHNEVEK